MANLNDIKSSFERKLDAKTQERQTRLATELDTLREQLLQQAKPSLPKDIRRRLTNFDDRINAQLADGIPDIRGRISGTLPDLSSLKTPAVQSLLDIGGADYLRQLDQAFVEIFSLDNYYSLEPMNYPTVYCESLEEYYTPIMDMMNLSPDARKKQLEKKIAMAALTADMTGGGGEYGYNLLGQGCYINGWLLVYRHELPPQMGLVPDLIPEVWGTAIHEKLGHGFLSAYSALGKVKSELGPTLIEIADRFEIRQADDPLDSLRYSQAMLLKRASQLVEEGWATWIQTFLGAHVLKTCEHPRHSLQAILQAIDELPDKKDLEKEKIQSMLLSSLETLFNQEEGSMYSLARVHKAVLIIELWGSKLGDFFAMRIGQSLCYAVGELLMVQAGMNLGPICVPYAALIAANVGFNPEVISLSDLREMFDTNPSLNPDTRLAVLSSLKLENPNDVAELARRAETELSFSVPKELKRKT